MQQTKVKKPHIERYKKYVLAVSPRTSLAKSLFHSFWVGGLTCVIAQGIFELFAFLLPSLPHTQLAALTLCVIIVVAVFLTGIGVYDKIGRYAGAGAFLPITGFANAMASASMEHKTEGLIFGSQTKFFSVVGPVLVNGIVWSALAGIIHYIILVVT